jgi:hypothetical protein
MDGNKFFRNLHSFFAAATQEKFKALWGREIGSHLWMKWAGYGRDLVQFLGNLDGPNREMLFRFCAKEEPAELEIPF